MQNASRARLLGRKRTIKASKEHLSLPQTLFRPSCSPRSGKNFVYINPKFKVFCRAFCKKLAAGGIRVPDKSKFANKKHLRKQMLFVLYVEVVFSFPFIEDKSYHDVYCEYGEVDKGGE